MTAPVPVAAPAQPAGPPAAAPPAAGLPVAAPPAPGRAATPRLLQLLSLGVVTATLLVGVLGAATFGTLVLALGRAQDDVTQLVRVQRIQTGLLSADATATNAFLVGGLEPAEQRASYDAALTGAATLIAEAARHQPADQAALQALNVAVQDYAATIEQARANNRQGLPVGAQYQRNASAGLRATALPLLDNLVAANAGRARAEMRVGLGWVWVAVAVLVLGGLVLAQVWLARRFRRTLNPGMLAGSLLVLAALLGGVIMLVQLGQGLAATRTGSLAATEQAAAARIAAYDAKSNESLTLIARGSGQAFESAWQASSATVERNLGLLEGRELLGLWQAYGQVHAAIREQDDGGRWDRAVALATGTGDDAANGRFSAFDSALAARLEADGQATSTALAGRTPGLVAAAVLLLLGGLAAGLLGRRGIGRRLREYR